MTPTAEAAVNSSTDSNYVYIQSDDYAWLPARVVEQGTEGDTVTVQVPVYKSERQMRSDGGRSATSFRKQVITLADYPNAALPLQNVNEQGQLLMVEDMVDLPFLHEVSQEGLDGIKGRRKARMCQGFQNLTPVLFFCSAFPFLCVLLSADDDRLRFCTISKTGMSRGIHIHARVTL
jgi:hypothetical protein